jgi:hypothetical protein
MKVLPLIISSISTELRDWELLQDFLVEFIITESKVVPVHAMKAYKGSGSVNPLILNLGARWRLVVNFMPWPLYPRERILVHMD